MLAIRINEPMNSLSHECSHSAFHRATKYHILYEGVANVFGLGVLLGTLKAGATCILMKRYDLDVFFQTVVKYKVRICLKLISLTTK